MADPILRAEPGATVELELELAERGAVVGPVAIAGAQPGDLLTVELLAIEPGRELVSSVEPDRSPFAALAGLEPLRAQWVATADGWLESAGLPGVRVPRAPFLGSLAVAGGVAAHGVRQGVAGAVWGLPVAAPEALFSLGDMRCALSAGAVCGRGVEVDGRVRMRLGLVPASERHRLSRPTLLRWPRIVPGDRGATLGTIGIAATVHEATEEALAEMLDHLAGLGLRGGEAATVCATALDLRISQMVNEPYVTVSALLAAEVGAR